MKMINTAIYVVALGTLLFFSSPVSAQSDPDSRTTTTETYDDDGEADYGWVGLLGLVGLAGLMKRNKDVRDGHNVVNAPKYNS